MKAKRWKSREPQCSQAWEVEAARDGRLSGDALDALARHVERCDECRELSEYFSALAHALRQLEPTPVEPARMRRLRRTLLRELDAELLRPPRVRASWLAGLAAAALVLALVVWSWPRAPRVSAVADAQRIEPVRERVEEPVAISVSPSSAPSAIVRSLPRVRPAPVAPLASGDAVDAAPTAAEEDVAYLHTVALLREGKNDEARVAARDYLRRFPRGFRYEEMKRIAEP